MKKYVIPQNDYVRNMFGGYVFGIGIAGVVDGLNLTNKNPTSWAGVTVGVVFAVVGIMIMKPVKDFEVIKEE